MRLTGWLSCAACASLHAARCLLSTACSDQDVACSGMTLRLQSRAARGTRAAACAPVACCGCATTTLRIGTAVRLIACAPKAEIMCALLPPMNECAIWSHVGVRVRECV